MSSASKLFYEKTHKEFVYNIMSLKNIPSVIQHGILSYQLADKLSHESIAMMNVQEKRDNICIPNGMPLHLYANTYFNPRNPMMFKRKDMAESLCILAVYSTVLDIKGSVVSDGNAASPYSRFFDPVKGIKQLDFARIYGKSWIKDNLTEQHICKRMECAEVLVPNQIPYEYIRGAIVVNEKAERKLKLLGFQKQIIIDPARFFRKEK